MVRFEVRGMSCEHCVRAITGAVAAVAPAASVRVDLDRGEVGVEGAADEAAVAAAIEAAGYTVARRPERAVAGTAA